MIFVTSHSEAGFEVSAFDMGAADFIAKPFRASLVKARVKTQLRLKHMTDDLRRIATTDSLTGVANRRQFDESLEHEWRRTLRAGDAISLLLVDVDHFKLYNDRYGHPRGDCCLRRVAEALTGACQRPSDLLARCGSEEFMALLPQTARTGAEHVARRMLDAVGALRMPHHDSPTDPNVTVSVGIAFYDESSAGWIPAGPDNRSRQESHRRSAANDLLRAADQALYSAKHAGRAQVKLRNIGDIDTLEPFASRSAAAANNASHAAVSAITPSLCRIS